MKVEELRIGNYYKWYADGKYYYFQVDNAFFMDINVINNSEPIELTEEILLKCGFELKGIIFRINNGFSNQFDINYSLSRDMFYYDSSKYGIYTEVEIKYLHQLQNLYFALTNEELNVQL